MSRSKEIVLQDRLSRFNQTIPRDLEGVGRRSFVLAKMIDEITESLKLVSIPCKIDDRGRRRFGNLSDQQLKALGKYEKVED